MRLRRQLGRDRGVVNSRMLSVVEAFHKMGLFTHEVLVSASCGPWLERRVVFTISPWAGTRGSALIGWPRVDTRRVPAMLRCRRRGGPQLPHQDSRCCPGEFTTTSLFGRKPPTKFDISVPVPPKLALEWCPLPWRTARESFVVARHATASNILSSLFFRLRCFVGPPSRCEKRGAFPKTQSRRPAVRKSGSREHFLPGLC